MNLAASRRYYKVEELKRVGLATKLEGKIHVSVFFVSSMTELWTLEDMTRAKKNLLDAESWLIGKAAGYGKELSFLNTWFGDENDEPIKIGDFQKYSGPTELKKKNRNDVMAKRRLGSWGSHLDFVKGAKKCEQGISVIIYVEPDRSYALRAWRQCELDTAMCHKGDSPGVYAHEILHLFGAWDLYVREFDKDRERGWKCRQYFNSSIMMGSSCYTIKKIDEINAWRVGLKREEKSWYKLFCPDWNNREDEMKNLTLYRDWRTNEYSDRPVLPKPAATVTKSRRKTFRERLDDLIYDIKYYFNH